MKRIYYMLNGALQSCTPTKSTDDFIEMVKKKDVPAGATNVVILDSDLIKAHPYFSEAWVIVNGEIVVDEALAKACKLKKIREERDAILQSTDMPYNTGVERGKDVSSLRSRRQSLRDLPSSLNLNGLSLDQLKDLDPLDKFR